MTLRGITVLAAALIGVAATAIAQQPPSLPYVAVHDPEFLPAADATFMHGDDRVIGVISGTTAKAFPAAILSQHGLVEDKSPKGPIAVTW
jgi:uncharacterized protein DUF3179